VYSSTMRLSTFCGLHCDTEQFLCTKWLGPSSSSCHCWYPMGRIPARNHNFSERGLDGHYCPQKGKLARQEPLSPRACLRGRTHMFKVKPARGQHQQGSVLVIEEFRVDVVFCLSRRHVCSNGGWMGCFGQGWKWERASWEGGQSVHSMGLV
jgi:hypothetical protein